MTGSGRGQIYQESLAFRKPVVDISGNGRDSYSVLLDCQRELLTVVKYVYLLNKPWRLVGVFPMTYEHLHI